MVFFTALSCFIDFVKSKKIMNFYISFNDRLKFKLNFKYVYLDNC